MTSNPSAPRMTETQRQEAMRRYGRGESLSRKIYVATKSPVHARGIRSSGKIKLDTIAKRFGSLEHACKLAGVPYAKLKGAEKFSDEALKERLAPRRRLPEKGAER